MEGGQVAASTHSGRCIRALMPFVRYNRRAALTEDVATLKFLKVGLLMVAGQTVTASPQLEPTVRF